MDAPFPKSKVLSFATSTKSSVPSNFNTDGSPTVFVPSHPDWELPVGKVKFVNIPFSCGLVKSAHIFVEVVLFADIPALS